MVRILSMAALALATPLCAQQDEAKLTWQRLHAEISYGTVRVGKHSLEQLPPGRHWGLNAGGVTTLTAQMPIVQGDDILPPGGYRLRVHRASQETFTLVADGTGGDRITLPGTFEGEHRPNKKLAIEFTKPKAGQTAGLHDATIVVHFGPYHLTTPLAVPGNKRVKTRGFQVHAFTWPADLVDRRLEAKKTPVATLTPSRKPAKGEPEFYNLLLTKDEVILAPASAAPEGRGRGGRGGQRGGAEAPVRATPVPERRGTIQWNRGQSEEASFSLSELKVAKDGSIKVEVRFGDRVGSAKIPARER